MMAPRSLCAGSCIVDHVNWVGGEFRLVWRVYGVVSRLIREQNWRNLHTDSTTGDKNKRCKQGRNAVKEQRVGCVCGIEKSLKVNVVFALAKCTYFCRKWSYFSGIRVSVG